MKEASILLLVFCTLVSCRKPLLTNPTYQGIFCADISSIQLAPTN